MSLVPVYSIDFPASGSSEQLVVVCHGLGMTRESMNDVVSAIRDSLPLAAIMNVEHAGKDRFSNADPIAVADTLNNVIGEAVVDHGFSSVILVGHSIGALLLRKAYVFARGFNQDSISPVAPHMWAACVENMVFLAAFNRGINFLERTPGRSFAQYYLIRFAYTFARLAGIAGFARRFERGGRFISNLRLQWLSATFGGGEGMNAVAMHRPSGLRLDTLPGMHGKLPPITQIVGIEDEFIGDNESNDVAVCGSFDRKNVPNTDHTTIVSFPHTSDGQFRKRVFLEALVKPTCLEAAQPLDARVQRIVFVMHGIRDYGFWVPRLSERIVRQATSTLGKGSVVTICSSYGYFPMLQFILWSDRQRNVRWFMDQLTEALARHPEASVDFVGHSNGTYLLASALRDYAATKFHNVVFAGSVVRRDFPWDTISAAKRVNAVRNYVASADWVVGFLPHFFEFLGDLLNRRDLRYFDIGGAGFLGFTSTVTAQDQVMFIRGGHGAAIRPENWRSIARYLLQPGTPTAQQLTTGTQSPFVSLWSRLCWAVWGAGIVALSAFAAAAGFGVFFLAKFFLIGGFAAVVLGVTAAFFAVASVYLITESY